MKKLIAIALLCTAVSFCGCSSKHTEKNESGTESDIIVVSDTSLKPLGDDRIKKTSSPEVSAPDGSITIEQACKLLDGCAMGDFYLSESMNTYKKYYFNTVDYLGEKYYSLYPYLETNGKKIFVGTNALVSCSGNIILAKNWMGGYENVDQTGSQNDKPYTERFADARISPNEALAALASKENLSGLDYSIEEYIFEFDDTTSEVNGIPCYRITPKLEYLDHIDLLSPCYVSADKNMTVFKPVKGKSGEFSELK